MKQLSQTVSKYQNARPIGNFLSKVTKPAFERFGFPTAALLTDWSAIVGPEIASYTQPERLKWPHDDRNSHTHSDYEQPLSTTRTGATLQLRVDGPRAIEIQFNAPQIIERINTYFGYRAVTQIRILQAPVSKPVEKQQKSAQITQQANPGELAGIENDTLKSALSRLGQNVRNR